MQKIFKIGWLVPLLIGLMLAGRVLAQIPEPTPNNQNLRQLLTYLNQQTQFLRDLAQQFPNPELDELISKIEMHSQNASQAQQMGQIRRAQTELKLAQQVMAQAFGLVMIGPVSRLQQQLDEQIRLAEEAIHRNFNSESQRLLQRAKESKRRAEQALQNKNIEKSIEWLRVSLFQATKALELVSPVNDLDLMSAIHEEKSNFNDLLWQAENLLQDHPSRVARELYNQAFNQQKKADASFSRGQVKQAIEIYRWGERLLLRVIDLVGATEVNWQQQANEEIYLTRESLRSIEQSVNLQHHPRLNQLYQQAMKVYLDAENSISAKNYLEAVKKAELSRRILNRANQLIEQQEGGRQQQMANDIETLQSLLNDLDNDITPEQNPAAAQMLDMAHKYWTRSEQAQQSNRRFLAQANLYLATRFAYGAQSLSQSQPDDMEQVQLSLEQYELFKDRLNKTTQRFTDTQDSQIRSWLEMTKDILGMAETAKEKEQYSLLLENVHVGLQLLDRIENRMPAE